MGGGIPKAKITIVCGKEDSGKTYLLLETIAKAQKEDPNFIAAWLEAEGSISIDDIRMLGIDESRFFYQPFDSKNGGEAAIDIIEATLKAGVDFYAVNSLKCLVPSEELNSSMTKQSIGLLA